MVVDSTLSKWYDNACKEEILESDFGGSVGGLERRDEKQENPTTRGERNEGL